MGTQRNSDDDAPPSEPAAAKDGGADGFADDEMTVADVRRARRSGPAPTPSWEPPPDEPPFASGPVEPPLSAPTQPPLSAPSQPPLSAPSRPPMSGPRLSEPPAFESEPALEPPPLDSIPPSGFDPPTASTATRPQFPETTKSVQTTGSSAATGVIGHEALRREREERSVLGLATMCGLSLLGAVGLQFAVDKPVTHYYVTGALIFLGLVAGGGSWLLHKKIVSDGGVSGYVMLLTGALVLLVMVGHLGVLSPMGMGLAILVYFDGTSDHRARGLTTFLVSAVGYLALTLLACKGVISPLLPAKEHIHPRATLLLGLTGEGLIAAAYGVAVFGRRRTIEAMERLESAQREIRRRQALLDEARADLDRALDAARVGRFTGQEIGPYLANDVIGRGGMGEVYRGVRTDTGDVVALKVLHPQFQSEQEQLERFFREAEATSQLDSPHIVRVMGRGTAPDGSPYLAMELLVGYDLAQALRKHSRLSLADVVTMVSQVALGLSAAQEAGIVHRDVKPQNVFRARIGTLTVWKVLDFGVSKMGDIAGTLTHGAIVGTPGYMSPEQARGQPVDHRSDVFSLAVLAYRALTGRPPFHASDPLGTTYQVVHTMPLQPSEIVKLPPDIDLVLAIALTKDKEHRFRSATSFAAALRDASRGELDERMRAAARDLLRHHPWGTERRA